MKKLFLAMMLFTGFAKAGGMGTSYNIDLLYLYMLVVFFLLAILGLEQLVKFVNDRILMRRFIEKIRHLLKFHH